MLRILFIEDDLLSAGFILARLMREEDENFDPLYRVLHASTLTEARQRLAAGDIDLLVSDTCVDANEPDAHLLVQEVRRTWPDLPIIGMSSSNFSEPVMRQAGVNEFYQKSFNDLNFDGLVALVKQLLPD